jgi:hypothetical protein
VAAESAWNLYQSCATRLSGATGTIIPARGQERAVEFLLIGFFVWMMLLVVAIAICRAAGHADRSTTQAYETAIGPRDEVALTAIGLQFPTA